MEPAGAAGRGVPPSCPGFVVGVGVGVWLCGVYILVFRGVVDPVTVGRSDDLAGIVAIAPSFSNFPTVVRVSLLNGR